MYIHISKRWCIKTIYDRAYNFWLLCTRRGVGVSCKCLIILSDLRTAKINRYITRHVVVIRRKFLNSIYTAPLHRGLLKHFCHATSTHCFLLNCTTGTSFCSVFWCGYLPLWRRNNSTNGSQLFFIARCNGVIPW